MRTDIGCVNRMLNRFNWAQSPRVLDELEQVEIQQTLLRLEQAEAITGTEIRELMEELETMEKTTFQEKDMALQIMADWFGLSKGEVNRALEIWSRDKEDPTRVERRSWECIARNNHVSVTELKSTLDNALKVYIIAVPGMDGRYYKRDKTTGEITDEIAPSKIGAGRFSIKELEEDFPELKPFAVKRR